MNSTQITSAPATGGRQVGQLLAGRYRLAMFKGGDDIADVWHALDESTEKVVTLEILRDRDNEAARQRFLAEANRMAAIERPSVMRVAAIHNEATDTFIVFEHLIPLPVVLTGLTAVAKDVRPATRAAENKTVDDKTAVQKSAAEKVAAETAAAEKVTAEKAAADRIAALTAIVPETPSAPPPSMLSAVAGPIRSAAPTPPVEISTPPTIVELEAPELSTASQFAEIAARLPEPLQAASRSLTAKLDADLIKGWTARLTEEIRGLVRDVGMDTFTADARAFIDDARTRVSQRFDMSLLTSLVARVSGLSARASAVASRVTPRARGAGAASARPAKPAKAAKAAKLRVERPGIAMPKLPSIGVSVPRMPSLSIAVPRMPSLGLGPIAAVVSLIARTLGSRLFLGGATLVLLGLVVVGTQLDETIVNAVRSAVPSPTAAPRAALAPAPFELPPLGAYGATFESQGAYPTTVPSGTVEWVVALRNTGSAGWYRGIEGAQAALALPDGAGVAVQSTEYVAPGQVGWFVVHFRARAELGTYTVQLLPRIDGRGPLPDLGIFAVVTVAKNP